MKNKFLRKAQKILQTNRKRFFHLILSKNVPQRILFIVGCQRSGTSILLNVFDRDLNTKCFAEFSDLTSTDTIWGIRLNSPEMMKEEFSKVSAPLIVAKPLVESQNIDQLLDRFDNSRAIWMFRNHKDVALSNVKHFGIRNGINDLRAIIKNEPNNWRSEKVPAHVRTTISEYFFEEMNPYDAAALFWFARNSIYFDLNLHEDSRVTLCWYEDFVHEPEKHMRAIYERVGQAYPSTAITSIVHSNSRETGKGIELSPQVELVAQELQNRLEAAYQSRIL